MQGTAGREKKKGEGALSNDVGKPVRSLFGQMVNFIPESRLRFIRISSIYRNTVAPKSETVLKDGFEQMEQEFPFGPFRPGQPNFLSCRKFRCYRKFYIGTTRKLVVHLHLNRNFWNLLETEKRPRFHPQAFPCIVHPAVRWLL